jgi:hypothetical protein
MSSANTLAVHDSLKRAGFEVWTPVERRIARMPRTKARAERDLALLPTYVFADARKIEALARLANVPNRDHPRFAMFKHQGGYPLVSDSALEALRGEETRKRGIFEKLKNKGRKGPTFGLGSLVKANSGGFEGLSGVVEGARGQYTLVSYAGFHKPIAIASLLLLPDVATDEKAHDAIAARAA